MHLAAAHCLMHCNYADSCGELLFQLPYFLLPCAWPRLGIMSFHPSLHTIPRHPAFHPFVSPWFPRTVSLGSGLGWVEQKNDAWPDRNLTSGRIQPGRFDDSIILRTKTFRFVCKDFWGQSWLMTASQWICTQTKKLKRKYRPRFCMDMHPYSK